MDKFDYNICSANCNGLGDKLKRIRIFKRLKRNYKGIMFLQETYTTHRIEGTWKRDIGKQYQPYFSHWKSNSRGVAIILPKNLVSKIIKIDRDNEGRFLLIQLQLENNVYSLINVYAPVQDKVSEQLQFLENLEYFISKCENTKMIIGGDFNIISDPKLDKWNAVSDKPSKSAIKLAEIKELNNLCDVWRTKNPETRRYTWRRHKPLQQSRIDLWLISDTSIYEVSECNIDIAYLSDHSIISIKFKDKHHEQRGRGYWKMNNSLLDDEHYIQKMYTLFINMENDLHSIDDKRLAWEYVKMLIRRETISYSIYKKKVDTAEKSQLLEQIELLETAICDSNTDNEDLVSELINVKHDFEQLENAITRGSVIRSRAQWTEHGERSSKYFFHLEKHNQELKHITSLTDDNGVIVDTPVKVMEKLLLFYKNLYTSKHNNNKPCFTQYAPDLKLDEFDSETLESDITLDECKEALEDLPVNKTPGSDGLTAEFYKKFWDVLNILFFESLQYSLLYGELSLEQRRGVLTLLPKAGKDLTKIKNWRPISILNVDYKIYAKILANRIKPVLPSIINRDQTGYIQGRLIGENVRTVKDIIDYFKDKNTESVLLFVDFEKAFDSLEWDFLSHSLESFGFGMNFIHYVKTLYSHICSSIINNGKLSESFSLERGIRQGCPVSAYLFIICAEQLSTKLRNSNSIKGITIGDCNYRVMQFADDTVIMANNLLDIKASLEILEEFATCSGLKVNRDKSLLVQLGINQHLSCSYLGLSWCHDEFKYLGITFTMDNLDMEYKNFRHRLEKIKNILKLWRQRDLSLRGKIIILKSLAMAQLIYPLSILEAPRWALEEANSLFYSFLWGNKPDKVKRNTIIREMDQGGLKMIDIECMALALKAKWVGKLFTELDQKWTNIPTMYFLDLPFSRFVCSLYKPDYIPVQLPPFYRQCLFSYQVLHATQDLDIQSIISQSLWFNRFIEINRQPVFNNKMYNKGIYLVNHLLDVNLNFLSLDEVKKKFDIDNLNFLEYYGIIQAIPKEWKAKLTNFVGSTTFVPDDHPMIESIGILKDLLFNTNKDLYWTFVHLRTKEDTTADIFWNEKFNMDKSCIKKIYNVPWQYVKETKIQVMQYKIIHLFYPSKLKLFHWKIKDSPICNYCTEVDNLEHHFFFCKETFSFWSTLLKWWKNTCQYCTFLDLASILLGVINKSCHKPQINFILLVAKWYIYRSKYLEKRLVWMEFLSELKTKLETESYISHRGKNINKRNKFVNMWQDILDSL